MGSSIQSITPRRVLILAPHVDDAEFGLGASIRKLTRTQAAEFCVVIAAYGDYARSDGHMVTHTDRMKECAESLSSLGVGAVKHARWFKENQGLVCDHGALVAGVESEIRDYEADDVYVCLPSFNQDHRALHDAALAAFRPGVQTANLYAYEYPGNAWGPQVPRHGLRYIEVNEVQVKRKIEALYMHRSQFEGRSVGVGPEAASRLARQRGAEINRPFAELTYVLKEIH